MGSLCYIHAADRPMLTDPGKGLGRALGTMIGVMKFVEPEKVIEFTDGEEVELAGLRFVVDLAPDTLRVRCCWASAVPGDDETRCASVSPATYSSRVDWPDGPAGRRSPAAAGLDRRQLPAVARRYGGALPGHGPQTTIGAERAANPFLAGIGGSNTPWRP